MSENSISHNVKDAKDKTPPRNGLQASLDSIKSHDLHNEYLLRGSGPSAFSGSAIQSFSHLDRVICEELKIVPAYINKINAYRELASSKNNYFLAEAARSSVHFSAESTLQVFFFDKLIEANRHYCVIRLIEKNEAEFVVQKAAFEKCLDEIYDAHKFAIAVNELGGRRFSGALEHTPVQVLREMLVDQLEQAAGTISSWRVVARFLCKLDKLNVQDAPEHKVRKMWRSLFLKLNAFRPEGSDFFLTFHKANLVIEMLKRSEELSQPPY